MASTQRTHVVPSDFVQRWYVPSDTEAKQEYLVTCLVMPSIRNLPADPDALVRIPIACTCKNFEKRAADCKHMTRVAKSVDGLHQPVRKTQ